MYQVKSGYQVVNVYKVENMYQIENVYQVENVYTNTDFAIMTVLERDSAQRGRLWAISFSLGAESHNYMGWER